MHIAGIGVRSHYRLRFFGDLLELVHIRSPESCLDRELPRRTGDELGTVGLYIRDVVAHELLGFIDQIVDHAVVLDLHKKLRVARIRILPVVREDEPKRPLPRECGNVLHSVESRDILLDFL